MITFEDCLSIASKYTKIVDFEKEYPELYQLSLENKWIYKFPNLRKPSGFWTRERIIDCMSLYSNYKTFCDEQIGANKAIRFHKWDDLKQILNTESRTHWDYDSAYKEAQKYEYRKDFMIGCPGAYSWMKRNNFLDDCEWLSDGKQKAGERRKSETYERYKQVALKCKTRKEFSERFPKFYNGAVYHGFLNDFDWLERATYDINDNVVYAYIFEKYHTIYIGRTIKVDDRNSAHQKDSTSAVYRFAHENNIDVPEMTIIESNLSLDDSLDREDYYVKKYKEDGWKVLNSGKTGVGSGSVGSIGSHNYITYEQCYRKAQQYDNVTDFRKKANTAYKRSHKMGWHRDYTWLYNMYCNSPYWTYERCHEECIKYPSRKPFREGSPSAYRRAKAEGWLDEWMPKKEAKWNYETVRAAAEKCKSIKEFGTLYPSAYVIAYERNWIDDFDWLERKKTTSPLKIKIVQQFSLDGTLIAEYNNVIEASLATNIPKRSIYSCCSGKLQKSHGFMWKFKDETKDENKD